MTSEYEGRLKRVHEMGGAHKLARRRSERVMHARERLDYLRDEGSFVESGAFATGSGGSESATATPADGKICGYGQIKVAPSLSWRTTSLLRVHRAPPSTVGKSVK